MRPFLCAFVCLSTLLAAQNVVAIAPAPTLAPSLLDSSDVTLTVEGQSVTNAAHSTAGRAADSEPATLGLFFAGLAGLTAAGGRGRGADAEPC